MALPAQHAMDKRACSGQAAGEVWEDLREHVHTRVPHTTLVLRRLPVTKRRLPAAAQRRLPVAAVRRRLPAAAAARRRLPVAAARRRLPVLVARRRLPVAQRRLQLVVRRTAALRRSLELARTSSGLRR